MGTPGFAATILERLITAGFEITAVVAQPNRPAGRGLKPTPPPSAILAREHSLHLLQPETLRDASLATALKTLAPDFIVTAAYGKLLPAEVLAIPRIDCLNVHASLLPRFRGAAPIQAALLAGDSETGVSIMRMEKDLDAGPVFSKTRLVIAEDDDAMSLTRKLSELGATALLQALPSIAGGRLNPEPQDDTKSTYAHRITRKTAVIDWNRPARSLFNQIRALVPWPVAQTVLSGKTLKLHTARPLTTTSGEAPGKIVHIGKLGITVATGAEDLLLTTAQFEGRNLLTAFDLANGLRLKPGNRLG